MGRKNKEKIQKLENILSEDLELTQSDIRKIIGVSPKSVKSYKQAALENLLNKGEISPEQFQHAMKFDGRSKNSPPQIRKNTGKIPSSEDQNSINSGEKSDEEEVNRSGVDHKPTPLISRVENLENIIKNMQGGKNMGVDEDTKNYFQNQADKILKKVDQKIDEVKKASTTELDNRLSKFDPLLDWAKSQKSQQEKAEEERRRDEQEKRIADMLDNRIKENLKKMGICDEQGRCRIPTQEELEQAKQKAKEEAEQETGVDLSQVDDETFLEEAEKRSNLSSGYLDIILGEKENNPVAVAKKVMAVCTSEEQCNNLKEYICKEHPTLCTLVTEQVEEKKEEARQKGDKDFFLTKEKKEEAEKEKAQT